MKAAGFEAIHWSHVGPGNAKDVEIIAWASEHGYIILTHDLDFSRIMALTTDNGPSVVRIRTPKVLPEFIGDAVVSVLERYRIQLEAGAIMAIDLRGARVRLLPINKQ